MTRGRKAKYIRAAASLMLIFVMLLCPFCFAYAEGMENGAEEIITDDDLAGGTEGGPAEARQLGQDGLQQEVARIIGGGAQDDHLGVEGGDERGRILPPDCGRRQQPGSVGTGGQTGNLLFLCPESG